MDKVSMLCIILAGVSWGTSGMFVHHLAPYGLTSLQMTTIRAAISALLLFLCILLRDKRLFRVNAKQLLLFSGSGISMLLTATCYFTSMQMTTVSTAVVLMYTAPVFVMIYSVCFLGERLTGYKFASIAVMLAGCCLVSGIIGNFKPDVKGILIGLVSGIAFSSYNILTKIQMKNNCNTFSATFYCFLSTMIFSMIFSGTGQIINVASSNPESIIIMIGCGIFTCVLPYFLYTYSLKALPVGTASAMGIVEPMAASLFSVLFLDESLNFFSAAGIVMILCAVLMLSKCND